MRRRFISRTLEEATLAGQVLKLWRLLILILLGLGAASQAELPPFELHDGDVVDFVGGTDMVRLQNDGHL